MAHIKKLTYDHVILSNGKELSVSRKGYSQIKSSIWHGRTGSGEHRSERISVDIPVVWAGMLCGNFAV